MEHAYYESYAGLLAAELLGLAALCDADSTFYARTAMSKSSQIRPVSLSAA